MVWQAYRRVASKGACSFCLMLASRGAVYSTAENAVAGHSVDASGHDHCNCSAELETDPANKHAIRIDPSDANKIIKSWTKRGKTASYDLAKFKKLGIKAPPKAKVPKAVIPKPRPKPAAVEKYTDLDHDDTGNYFVKVDGEEVWVVRELDELGYRRGQWIYGGPVGPGITNRPVPKALADWLDERAPVFKTPDEIEFEKLPRDPTMVPDEALRGTNPQHYTGAAEYTHNCTRCVVAYEMRRRGLVVEAAPRPTGDVATKVVRDAFDGRSRPTDWIDFPSIYDVGDGFEDGARFIIRVSWRSSSGGRVGHVLTAERRRGKTVFLEPQSGHEYTRRQLKDYTDISAIRVDKLDLKAGSVRFVTPGKPGAARLSPLQRAAEAYRQGERRYESALKLKSVKGQTKALNEALELLREAEKLYRTKTEPSKHLMDRIADIRYRLASMP